MGETPMSRARVQYLLSAHLRIGQPFRPRTGQSIHWRAMRYGVAMVTVIAWGLWFGGMGALFLFVSYLFVTDRKIAILAAPRMFAVFETYQLFVATAALVAAAAWRLLA